MKLTNLKIDGEGWAYTALPTLVSLGDCRSRNVINEKRAMRYDGKWSLLELLVFNFPTQI